MLPAAEAEQLLTEKAAPSLRYKELSSITGSYDSGRGKHVDAVAGKVINALGNPAESKPVQPLGTSRAGKADSEKRVTKQQAQQIAEQLIQKLPGEYRSDGIEIRSWNFEFTPLQAKDKPATPVQLSINDRGQLEEFILNERSRFGETGRKIANAVPWKTAEDSAVKLVKTLYADRLGEISLLDQKTSDAYIEDLLERGRSYEVSFGWLKNGVPLENAEFSVQVNPQTGEAENMWVRPRSLPDLVAASGEKAVEVSAAKKTGQEHKTLTLTYYQPKAGVWDLPAPDAAPLLAYRYAGDEGVVDAETGEWISFEQEKKDFITRGHV